MPGDGRRPTAHEVLAAVLQIRGGALQVLAWRRAQPPDAGRWALPGGLLGDDEDVEASVRRQLAEKVDVREIAHVEQLAVFSAPDRVPGVRRVATAFLGLVPSDADPAIRGMAQQGAGGLTGLWQQFNGQAQSLAYSNGFLVVGVIMVAAVLVAFLLPTGRPEKGDGDRPIAH